MALLSYFAGCCAILPLSTREHSIHVFIVADSLQQVSVCVLPCCCIIKATDGTSSFFGSPKFNDMDLLSVLIKMAASDVLATISNVGHKYAMMSASAALSPVAEMIEMFFGFKQVVFLKNVVEEDIQSVANKLEAIAAYVFESSQMRYFIQHCMMCYQLL